MKPPKERRRNNNPKDGPKAVTGVARSSFFMMVLQFGQDWQIILLQLRKSRIALASNLPSQSAVRVSRLGLGLGVTFGRVFRDMGQGRFTDLIHYAYDRGIRYFDCAGDTYPEMHVMLGKALVRLPRDSYALITQTGPDSPETTTQLLGRYQAGKGVNAMKVFGGNGFKSEEARRRSIQYVLQCGCADALAWA
jgi:hypothetical protein